jgi:hypothetical protein
MFVVLEIALEQVSRDAPVLLLIKYVQDSLLPGHRNIFLYFLTPVCIKK